jgi:hypothetical protein
VSRTSLTIGCLLLVAVAARADVNDRIVEFCKQNKEKPVGDGDCYDLAKFALNAAGAKPQFRNPDYPAKGDYVWGQLALLLEATEKGPKRTGKVSDIKPGDVIQSATRTGKASAPAEKATTR